MPSSEKKLLLKVFSGPHVGAEVLLGAGEHVIGSGEDCDVILNDSLIAKRHARLTIQGDKVRCTPFEGAKVFIDGKETPDARLEAFEYFTLGNTHLAVGPPDSQWPHRDFPGFQLNAAVEEATPADETPAAEDRSESQAAEQTTSTGRAAAAPESGDATRPSTAAGKGPASADGPSAAPRWPWIAGGSVLATLFVVALTLFVRAELRALHSSEPAPVTLAQLRAVIAESAPHSTVEAAAEDGYFIVKGYVSDRAVKDRLRDALLELNAEVDFNVIDTQSLASAAREVLEMHGLPLTASAGKLGQVVVAGDVDDRGEWERVRGTILHDVSKIEELDDTRVTTRAADVAATQSVPTPADPPPQPPPEPTPPPAEVAADRPELPHLEIRSLSIGRRRMLTLVDGARIFEGGMLQDGYVVKSIEPDRLVLSREGKDLLITLGTTP